MRGSSLEKEGGQCGTGKPSALEKEEEGAHCGIKTQKEYFVSKRISSEIVNRHFYVS